MIESACHGYFIAHMLSPWDLSVSYSSYARYNNGTYRIWMMYIVL